MSFILGSDTDHQQSSMKVMDLREVTSYFDTSKENVDISIIESTCLNDRLLNVSNDITQRENSKYPIFMSTWIHTSSALFITLLDLYFYIIYITFMIVC